MWMKIKQYYAEYREGESKMRTRQTSRKTMMEKYATLSPSQKKNVKAASFAGRLGGIAAIGAVSGSTILSNIGFNQLSALNTIAFAVGVGTITLASYAVGKYALPGAAINASYFYNNMKKKYPNMTRNQSDRIHNILNRHFSKNPPKNPYVIKQNPKGSMFSKRKMYK
jgi:hypothetical protein